MKSFLIIIALSLAACKEEPAAGDITAPTWDTTFFAPQVGEKWIYRATTTSLAPASDSEESRQVQTVLERTQTYLGRKIIEGKTHYQNSVHHDGVFNEGIVLGWDGQILTISGDYTPETPAKLMQNPVPIAQIGMVPGTYWHWPTGASSGSGSRVVAFEFIKVPAGTFEAYKISIRKNAPGAIILREYWFAPKVGIIKETNRIHSGGKLQSITSIELTSRVVP